MVKETFIGKIIATIAFAVALVALAPTSSMAEVDKKYKVDLRLLPLLEQSRNNLQTEKGLRIAEKLYEKAIPLKDTLAQMYALGDQLVYYMYTNDSAKVNKVANTMRGTASKSHRYVYYYYHAWHQQVTTLVKNQKLYIALSEGNSMLKRAAKETNLKQKVKAGITYLCYDILYKVFKERGDNANAEKMLLKSIDTAAPHSNLHLYTAVSYINLADIYIDERKYKKALATIEKGMIFAEGSTDCEATLLDQKACAMFALGRTADFLATYGKIAATDSLYKPNIRTRVCKLIAEGKYDQAHKLANSSQSQYTRCQANIAIYKYESKWKDAYDCEQQLRTIEKQKQQQLMSNDLAELNAMYETEKLKTDNMVLELENGQAESKRQRLIIVFVTVIAIIVVSGISILLRNSKQHIKVLNAKNREIVKARDKAERSDQMKSKFIENISHEIRTPLNAIVGFSDLLCAPNMKFSEKDRMEFCQTISKNSGLLTTIVAEMIDISELQSGTMTAQITPCNCNEVCQLAISAVDAKKPENVDMTFTTDIAEDFTINTDQRRLQQVLFHFLTNAEKFTTQGTINLDCSKEKRPGFVTFTVTDTGCGIPIDKQQEVFSQFEKNDKMEQGVGLGLSLCTMIAHLLKADIGIDPAYTSGARFYFAIPV